MHSATKARPYWECQLIARAAQRCLHTANTGDLIPRIVVYQCRVTERYRTRVIFSNEE
jgi:hypothetical protein